MPEAQPSEHGELDIIEATQHYEKFEDIDSAVFQKYRAAMQAMDTRLEIMNDALGYHRARNPIHHIESRLKTPTSALEKLQRYGKPISTESMEANIMDIAGLRVICAYPDDVYRLVELVERQDDLEIVKIKDYIKHPKPNGYRSLHLIVRIPIYSLSKKEYVPVEIQFRTIAMDLWASLEHDLRYKAKGQIQGIDVYDELKDCSDIICGVEARMQILMRAMENEPESTRNHKPGDTGKFARIGS